MFAISFFLLVRKRDSPILQKILNPRIRNDTQRSTPLQSPSDNGDAVVPHIPTSKPAGFPLGRSEPPRISLVWVRRPYGADARILQDLPVRVEPSLVVAAAEMVADASQDEGAYSDGPRREPGEQDLGSQ